MTSGDDYDAGMARVAADQGSQPWWTLADPFQHPLPHAEATTWLKPPEIFPID